MKHVISMMRESRRERERERKREKERERETSPRPVISSQVLGRLIIR
jgi:hypothetical protein